MNQLYIGEIVALYINLSKKNKEYSSGYIRLPDANNEIQSYKFVIFKTDIVQKLKDFGPTNLKGKTIGFVGEFRQNTYNGVTEYQLIVNELSNNESIIHENFDITEQPVEPQNSNDIPQIPTV